MAFKEFTSGMIPMVLVLSTGISCSSKSAGDSDSTDDTDVATDDTDDPGPGTTCTISGDPGPDDELLPFPTEVEWEEPTLHSLGVRWWISDNAHGEMTVEVDYRKAGESAWCLGLPLFRVEREAIIAEDAIPINATLYAGSLLYLEPGTEYEVKLVTVTPEEERVGYIDSQTTRLEPIAPEALRTLHVVPGTGGGTGTEGDPFRGFTAANDAAQAGDHFLIHAGTYVESVSLTRDGEAQAPIVWQNAGDGDVIIQPDTAYGLTLYGRSHLFIEGLTIQNANYAIVAAGAHDIVIRGNRLDNVSHGIFADSSGQERFFIADNIIDGAGSSDRGIELAGTGHIIAYNRVSGFGDCIVTRTPWPLRGIDIHNNDISSCGDDGIELDFSQHNVRAYRNRITNTTMGISFQPSGGGPNYAVHNSFYNIGHEIFKLHLNIGTSDRTSGGVIFHNTVVKRDVAFRVWSDEGPAHYFTAKNNLMIGLPAQYALELTPLPMLYADFDYNAWTQTSSFAFWNGSGYATLAEFQGATGLETHSLIVDDYSVLFDAPISLPEYTDIDYPVQDLRLKAGAPVVDQGLVLPGINDDFEGDAPDIGAYELGRELPHYGPR